MIAAVHTKVNAPLSIMEVSVPAVLDYGQVLVQVLASGICGAQLQEIAGHKGDPKHLPHLLGHEGVGIVKRCGFGVSRVKNGDKVVMHWRKAAGTDAPAPIYWNTHNATTPVRAGKITTFNQEAIVSENRLTPVPEDTPNELCALLGCGLSTALGTMERDAAVKFGESVMIIGFGGLGVNLLLAARLAGATPITVVDVHESKRKQAIKMGADFFLNSGVHTRPACPDRRPADWSPSVIIDTAGSPASILWAMPLLADSGRYILVGQPKPDEAITIANARHLFDGEGKTLKATQGGGFKPDVDIPRYVRLHKAGLLNLKGIITHRIRLEDINEGLDMVRKGEASRVLVKME